MPDYPIQTAQTASRLSLEYVRQGRETGSPLVFLHGFTDSCRSFSRLFGALADDINAIAISLRGHGNSDRPKGPYDIATMARDVAELLDFLGFDQVSIVGHCMGGFVAQRFALDLPERVSRLILIDSFPTMAGNEAVAGLAEEIANFPEGPVDPDFVRAFQESTVVKPVPAEFMDMIVAESMKLPGWTWQAIVDALMQKDITRELSGVTAPTLLICGDEDALFGLDYQHRLLAALPTASLEVLPGLGHSPHWEDPQAVAKLIAEFAHSANPRPLELQE
jgi:non-heme chloroperoxidase